MAPAAFLVVFLLVLALPAPLAGAQLPLPPLPAQPIPEGDDGDSLEQFEGRVWEPRGLRSPPVPQHPFMAPNGKSNLHVDGFQTDAHGAPGPLGRDIQVQSTFQAADCASVTFDAEGRIVTVCVGLNGPTYMVFDARTLETVRSLPLPPRIPGGGNIFQDFAGGGYFYLDHRDRAVIPTTTRHVWVVHDGGLERDYDLTGAVAAGDKIISALPDWRGLVWFASVEGVVGTLERGSGRIRSLPLGERIANSMAVDDRGGVYVVTDAALYRLDAARDGTPKVTWRRAYENAGQQKPGQSSAGSGTTPTVFGRGGRWVAITDNADPMNVLVYRKRRRVKGRRLVCRVPVLPKGSSATDQSLVAVGRSLVVESNFGYTGPTVTEGGKSTAPGLERVDVRRCRRVWRSDEIAPSVVPKVSLANGLLYTYTKPPRPDGIDAWYLTALDFRTGETVYRHLAGTGLGFNNNYAPVTLAPDGAAYVGTLGGLVQFRDAG